MKCVIIFAMAMFSVLALTNAFPSQFDVEPLDFESGVADSWTIDGDDADAVMYRPKRATCDLLSGLGLGHSACAAHCLARGRRGGWCDSHAVCNCRR